MKIEEVIAKLKEDGKNDEEIKAILVEVRKDIDAYLGEDAKEEKKEDVKEEVKKDEESEEDKRKRIFGL